MRYLVEHVDASLNMMHNEWKMPHAQPNETR